MGLKYILNKLLVWSLTTVLSAENNTKVVKQLASRLGTINQYGYRSIYQIYCVLNAAHFNSGKTNVF